MPWWVRRCSRGLAVLGEQVRIVAQREPLGRHRGRRLACEPRGAEFVRRGAPQCSGGSPGQREDRRAPDGVAEREQALGRAPVAGRADRAQVDGVGTTAEQPGRAVLGAGMQVELAGHDGVAAGVDEGVLDQREPRARGRDPEPDSEGRQADADDVEAGRAHEAVPRGQERRGEVQDGVDGEQEQRLARSERQRRGQRAACREGEDQPGRGARARATRQDGVQVPGLGEQGQCGGQDDQGGRCHLVGLETLPRGPTTQDAGQVSRPSRILGKPRRLARDPRASASGLGPAPDRVSPATSRTDRRGARPRGRRRSCRPRRPRSPDPRG